MRRQRGVTLLEIMLSMAVVLVGMAALFRVLSVASRGSQASQRITQALARGQHVMEAIRTLPPTVLECLVINPATSWNNCETLCRTRLGPVASQEACVFSTLATLGQAQDGTRQQYAVIYDGANFQDGSTWVLRSGPAGAVYDAQVVIGWRDDDPTAPLPQASPCGGVVHCVTLRASLYRGGTP